jgi:hypothetical protein
MALTVAYCRLSNGNFQTNSSIRLHFVLIDILHTVHCTHRDGNGKGIGYTKVRKEGEKRKGGWTSLKGNEKV